MPEFRFLTNHALVLSHVALKPRITARDLAATIGITERATLRIINELIEEDYITKTREGRRNHYRINPDRPINPPGLEVMAAETLLRTLGWKKRGRPRKNPGNTP